jgi:hypothetical protein
MVQTVAVEPFGIVVIIVCLLAIAAAGISIVGRSNVYKDIGKGAFSLDTPDRVPGPPAGSAAARAEAEAEIRQMLEAKSARREARGEPPLDIDAEVAALLGPQGGSGPGDDPELREEVRQLVIASNERRVRRGEEPRDVEEEVDRQLRELGA